MSRARRSGHNLMLIKNCLLVGVNERAERARSAGLLVIPLKSSHGRRIVRALLYNYK